MEEKNKESFLSRFIYIVVIFLAIIYTDSYGIVTLLGCYSLVKLYGNVDYNQKIHDKGKKYIILFVSSILLMFLIMFIFRYTDYNVSYIKRNFVIVPSFWLLLFL